MVAIAYSNAVVRSIVTDNRIIQSFNALPKYQVKSLYAKRLGDVRMLIPVLPGLDQKQIEDLLPKIIKQSSSVVKEAFKRVLSPFKPGGSGRNNTILLGYQW